MARRGTPARVRSRRAPLTLFLFVHLHFLPRVAKIRHKAANQARAALSSEDTRDGRQSQHQTDHNAREVPRNSAVEDQEDTAVADFLEEQIDSNGSERNHDLEIQEEGGPRGRLVLRHRGNDRNVFGGVGRVQQRQRPACPASDSTLDRSRKRPPEDLDEDEENDDGHDEGEDRVEEIAIVLLGELIVGEHQQRVA